MGKTNYQPNLKNLKLEATQKKVNHQSYVDFCNFSLLVLKTLAAAPTILMTIIAY